MSIARIRILTLKKKRGKRGGGGKKEMSCLQKLGKVVKWKPTLIPALPEILIVETMVMSRQQQSWTLVNSKDSQDFIKKFLSWCRQQIIFWGMMPKPDLKEPGKKSTWILPGSFTTGLKRNTLHPMHMQKAIGSSTSHDLNWSSPGWNDAGRLYHQGAQNGTSYMLS